MNKFIRAILDMNRAAFLGDIETLRESYKLFLTLVDPQKEECVKGYEESQKILDNSLEEEWKKVEEENREVYEEMQKDMEYDHKLDMGELSDEKNLMSAIRYIDYSREECKKILKDMLATKNKMSRSRVEEEFYMEQIHLESYYGNEFHIATKIETNFCNSIVISVYALIRKYLNDIYRLVYNKPSGDIETIIKYMKNHTQIEIDDKFIVFWDSIKAIRDTIINEDGATTFISDEDVEKIKRMNEYGCEIKPDNRIALNPKFIEHCFGMSGNIVLGTLLQILNDGDSQG